MTPDLSVRGCLGPGGCVPGEDGEGKPVFRGLGADPVLLSDSCDVSQCQDHGRLVSARRWGRMTSPFVLMQERRRCLADSRAPSARPPGEAELS